MVAGHVVFEAFIASANSDEDRVSLERAVALVIPNEVLVLLDMQNWYPYV